MVSKDKVATWIDGEIARTIWRLQFVPEDVEVSAAITTGVMFDGTEIEVIVRGIKHHA